MKLENLIMFSSVTSGAERDMIYKRMCEAAQNGTLQNFQYDRTWLIDEDIEWLNQKMLTLLENYDTI